MQLKILGLIVISIIDDDESIRAAMKGLLRSVGYQVNTFSSAEGLLESGSLPETRCLVVDVRLPGMSGLELQRQLNHANSHIPIIFVSAHDDRTYREMAMEAGAAGFFSKPFEVNAFVLAVHKALQTRENS